MTAAPDRGEEANLKASEEALEPAAPDAAEPSRADAIVGRNLGGVLRPYRDEIIEGHVRALHGMSGTGYAAQPVSELRKSVSPAFDAIVQVLEHGRVRELRVIVAELAELRAEQGFRMSEPLRAYAQLRSGIDRVLEAVWADDPSALLAGTQRVQRAIDLAMFEFADAYVDAVQSDTAQYLRRLRELNAQLTDESTHDDLTGLYDRGYFDVALEREMSRAQRYGRPLAMVMADIDRFKRFSDAYGHQMGDLALQHVAGLLLGAVRATDYVCRYGGEEFAIVLPETDLSRALVMAERARSSIEVRAVNVGTLVSLTVSLGVAVYPDHAPDGPTLVARADEALYAAKAAGRNRVVAASGTQQSGSRSGQLQPTE